MALVKEPVTPSLIPNTTMVKGVLNGVHKTYEITPVEGYVLHDNGGDVHDPNGDNVYRYSGGSCSCGASYDFSTTELTVPDVNGNMVTVTAYGSREFFAFPANLVPDPEYNIYGGGGENAFAEKVKAEERAVF